MRTLAKSVMAVTFWSLAIAATVGTPKFGLAGPILASDPASDVFGARIAKSVGGFHTIASKRISEAEEGMSGTNRSVMVPAGSVDYAEQGVDPKKGVSDTLAWPKFELTLFSDGDVPGRSPSERVFVDFSLLSDPDTRSDRLEREVTIFSNGVRIARTLTLFPRLPEMPGGESTRVTVPPDIIDLGEANGEDSDRLRIPEIVFTVTSDGNPCTATDTSKCVPPSGGPVIPDEDGIALRIRADSDEDVPEPGTLMLLVTCLLTLALSKAYIDPTNRCFWQVSCRCVPRCCRNQDICITRLSSRKRGFLRAAVHAENHARKMD
jgi:hypothetical protein